MPQPEVHRQEAPEASLRERRRPRRRPSPTPLPRLLRSGLRWIDTARRVGWWTEREGRAAQLDSPAGGL
ncbi:hypothetical protein BHE74_00058796 [Ensete ventricosum]|nr:hypothetical protein BHE74_00058796 [Ensete ventricosum]